MAKSDVLVRMKADTQNYDANIAKARRQLDQFKKDNLSMGGVLKQLNGSLIATAARFASVTAAVGALGAAFKSNIETARNFEKSMSQLSSLTGMVGSDLDKLKEYAIELGASTTLSASQVADAFKLIGSQQPQLLSSGEALKAVTKNAITLAEAAGIELSDAAKTLSVSINQMGGDSNNAERYINVLAAASQKGAGDIVWLGEAITKSGTTAKAVGTDYEELVANLEQLAKAGYDASTAGTALRSIIMNLEKQANQQYKPSVVGLTEAFKNLGEANLTLTEYQSIAGKMFAAQAKALADAAGEAENMTTQITGTNIAEEQAKTNTDNLDGSLKSLASAWEGLNLHINSSNGLLRDAVDWLKDVVTWADEAYQSLERYYNGPSGPKEDIGNNIDDKGNYIKRPANGNWAGFDAKNGTWMPGYTGAIYNSATGQTELPDIIVNGTKRTGGGGGGKGGNTSAIDEIIPEGSVKDLTQQMQELKKAQQLVTNSEDWKNYETQIEVILKKINLLTGKIGMVLPDDNLQNNISSLTKGTGNGIIANPFAADSKKTGGLNLTLDDKAMKSVMQGVEKSLPKVLTKEQKIEGMRDLMGGVSGVLSGIQQIGIEIPEEIQRVMGALNGIMTVVTGIESIISIGQFMGWFANGGVVHAAEGFSGVVPGNHFSGDNIPALLDSGEVVLNRAQAGVLAASLEAGDRGGGYIPSHVTGEQIWIALNAYAKRTGRGELVTWR